MDVIVIKGKCNTGKSSSIRYAMIQLLQDKGFVLHYNSKGYSLNGNLAECIKTNFKTPTELIGQITIIGNIGDKVVCITTYGDSFKNINAALEKAKRLEDSVDVFVCAAHGNALIELNNIGSFTPIEKSVVEDENLQEFCNKDDANKIVNKI